MGAGILEGGAGIPEGWERVYHRGQVYQRGGAGIPEGEVGTGIPKRGWEWVYQGGQVCISSPPGAGHHNTCGWQAVGMRPTGMLFCSKTENIISNFVEKSLLNDSRFEVSLVIE